MLTVISAVYLLALVVLVVEMVTAPVGYQDHDGFHCGDEPAANFNPHQTDDLEDENVISIRDTVVIESKPRAVSA